MPEITLTDELLAQEIEYWEWELGEHEDTGEYRDAKWHSRRNGIQHMIDRFQEEQARRTKLQEKLERLGSLSIESTDPAQLPLPLR